MNVFIVIWGFTTQVESVWATRELAESHVWALGDVGHEVVEMVVQGLTVVDALEPADPVEQLDVAA